MSCCLYGCCECFGMQSRLSLSFTDERQAPDVSHFWNFLDWIQSSSFNHICSIGNAISKALAENHGPIPEFRITVKSHPGITGILRPLFNFIFSILLPFTHDGSMTSSNNIWQSPAQNLLPGNPICNKKKSKNFLWNLWSAKQKCAYSKIKNFKMTVAKHSTRALLSTALIVITRVAFPRNPLCDGPHML